jgi:hypothetical protein
MRTTVNLEQDVVEAARSLARQEGISLGSAITRLIRRGLRDSLRARESYTDDAIPSFDVAEGTPMFGTDEVREALEDE